MSALWSIGPRQTTAESSSTKKPIDITFTPCASRGMILRSAETSGRVGAEPEHARDRVAPDVGVENADALAFRCERGGEVGRQGRLADPALARADAQDVRDLRERALGEGAAPELLLQGALLLVGEDVEVDVHVGHTRQRGDRAGDGGLEVALDRASGRGQGDGDVHDAVRAELDRADHVQLDDRAVQLRVDDDLERLEDLILARHGAPLWQTLAVMPGMRLGR